MELMEITDKRDVREILSKNWMTHDAMWYGVCVQELGSEKANQFSEKNLMQGRFNECFAHTGVSKYGLIGSYECGIVERIKGWLDGLGVWYVMEPDITGCLMHQNGRCEISFRFDLC